MAIPRRRRRLRSSGRSFALSASLLVTTILSTSRAAAQRVRPLDPLTPREVQLAQRAARGDVRVRDLVGDRRNVIGSVYLVALKPQTPEGLPMRSAAVEFYVYDGDYGVRALVDLTGAAVTQVEKVEGESFPFATEEIATAKRLAIQDTLVKRNLGPQAQRFRVDWLGFRPSDERDPCFRHRCVQLLFSRHIQGRDLYLPRPRVVVDLTTQTVRVEEP